MFSFPPSSLYPPSIPPSLHLHLKSGSLSSWTKYQQTTGRGGRRHKLTRPALHRLQIVHIDPGERKTKEDNKNNKQKGASSQAFTQGLNRTGHFWSTDRVCGDIWGTKRIKLGKSEQRRRRKLESAIEASASQLGSSIGSTFYRVGPCALSWQLGEEVGELASETLGAQWAQIFTGRAGILSPLKGSTPSGTGKTSIPQSSPYRDNYLNKTLLEDK